MYAVRIVYSSTLTDHLYLAQKNMRQELKAVPNAYHDRKETCLKDTRVELLAELMQWIQYTQVGTTQDPGTNGDIRSKKIVWLRGMAGSGKSTIANTIAANLLDEEFHLACFFCKRDDADRSSAARIFPTLSYQLTRMYPAYRNAIFKWLEDADYDKEVGNDLSSQVDMLFSKIFAQTMKAPMPLVLVIDALDECSDPTAQTKVVEGLITIAEAIPWIKILVTSRDEGAIRTGFARVPAGNFHDIDINQVDNIDVDIRAYTVSELQEMGLGTDHVPALVEKAGGLFIWSATVLKFLKKRLDKEEALQKLLESAGSDVKPLEQLYGLYDQILAAVSSELLEDEIQVIRRALAVIYVSSMTTPLPASAIATFLKRSAKSVGSIVRAFHAVLYEDKNGGGVRVFHPSFLDYVGKKEGQDGWDMLTHIHRLMFEASLAIMDDRLEFNICGLKDASLLNKDVPGLDRLVAKLVPSGLLYSCEHWFTHLHHSNLISSDAGLQTNVSRLVCNVKVVFWLEVLSLTGAAERSIRILQQCARYFEVCRHHFLSECMLTNFKELC